MVNTPAYEESDQLYSTLLDNMSVSFRVSFFILLLQFPFKVINILNCCQCWLYQNFEEQIFDMD